MYIEHNQSTIDYALYTFLQAQQGGDGPEESRGASEERGGGAAAGRREEETRGEGEAIRGGESTEGEGGS